jgi:DNA (cytosine-5)-methyltransferase 1
MWGIRIKINNIKKATAEPRAVASVRNNAGQGRGSGHASLQVVSLFCGPGGFDVGFAQAGFTPVLAIDSEAAACETFRRNHEFTTVLELDLSTAARNCVSKCLRNLNHGSAPVGVIGGPPCQAFSLSNGHKKDGDVRAELPRHYAAILKELNSEYQIDFFVFENVPGLKLKRHQEVFDQFKRLVKQAGFRIFEGELNALDFGVPQVRKRVFVVGFNDKRYADLDFKFPAGCAVKPATVREAIVHLPQPLFFQRGVSRDQIPHHPNHWCMSPRSSRFTNGTLGEGSAKGRAFRVLSWDEPSWTVAYGHREVHIHPTGKRRLSVYEAMLLQGFPPGYELWGTLSDQIRMVSDAVSPPVARALAESIYRVLKPR